LRHLGRPVTDSSISLAPLVPLELQDSPLFIPLSTCFANTFETYPYGGEKEEGGLRPIRYKPLRHFAPCRSRSAHNKSSCLGRHDVTARQKRGHHRIPQRTVNLGCAVLRIDAVNRRAARSKGNDQRGQPLRFSHFLNPMRKHRERKARSAGGGDLLYIKTGRHEISALSYQATSGGFE
jgi:hypothetical protein